MVFKGRFFFSKKSSDSSSSPDGSNSSKTPTLGKNKSKSPASSSSSASASPAAVSRHSLIRDAVKQKLNPSKYKDNAKDKAKESSTPTPPSPSSPATPISKLRPPPAKAAVEGSLSPIMASSLGLNRIKTRSGPLPLPQEAAQRMSALGSSNLGRISSDGNSLKSSGKKKDAQVPVPGLEKVPETNVRSWGKDCAGDLRCRSQVGDKDAATSSGRLGMAHFV